MREDDEGGVTSWKYWPKPLRRWAAAARTRNVGPGKIIIKLDPSKREVMRFVRETVEQYRGNGSAAPVHVKVPEGGQTHEVRTELLAEFNDAFRQALERILGRQTVWME